MSVIDTPALLLQQDLSMSVGSRSLKEPGRDEALVRVRWAGLCGSDLHVMRTGAWVREWPATLGHEIYGTIEWAPDGSGLSAGQPIVADSRVPCGQCRHCLDHRRDECIHPEFVGEARPGGFAQYCVLPVTTLHRVPAELAGANAALSEPLAVILHGLSLLRSYPKRALVIGHGPIGALANIELRRRFPNVEVDVAEPAQLRASLARALGSRTVAATGELESSGYDTVIDAAGYVGSLTDAIGACAPRGQVLVLSLSDREVSVRPADLVESNITLIGSNAFVDELPAAIELLAAEAWRYQPVITDAVSLDELPDVARAQLREPDAVKVLVCP
jgi:threonine dehydrogenase-like Zn-dependent dehydrogenase